MMCRNTITRLVAAGLLGGCAVAAHASVFTLDFETPSTGSGFNGSNTLVTPLGTVTLSTGTTCNPPGTNIINFGVELGSHVLCSNNDTGSNFMTLSFDFAVDSLSFDWGMQGDTGVGAILAEVLDASSATIGSQSLAAPSGTGNASFDPAAGIYAFRFERTVDSYSAIDNLVLTTADAPEPATLALVGVALAGVALSRRRSA